MVVTFLSKTYKVDQNAAYLAGGHDLTLDLPDLVLSLHVVPELGASKHCVASKHSHSEELGVGVLLRRESTADNLELPDLFKVSDSAQAQPGGSRPP